MKLRKRGARTRRMSRAWLASQYMGNKPANNDDPSVTAVRRLVEAGLVQPVEHFRWVVVLERWGLSTTSPRPCPSYVHSFSYIVSFYYSWLAEHGSGKVCVSISSHDADGRVVALACQPCGAALGDSQVIVSLDYSERLVRALAHLSRKHACVDSGCVASQSLFVSEDELDDFGTAATRFCHEGKAKTVAEVMGFLAANIGPYLSSGECASV